LSTDIDVVAVGNSFFSSRFTPVSRCFFKIWLYLSIPSLIMWFKFIQLYKYKWPLHIYM
jgi:hypothetical protein